MAASVVAAVLCSGWTLSSVLPNCSLWAATTDHWEILLISKVSSTYGFNF